MNTEKYSISSGEFITLWRLLFLISKYENIHIGTAIEAINNTGIFGGKVPVQEAVNIGVRYDFIQIKSSKILLTDFCKNEILILCDEDFPNTKASRAILSQILSFKNFHWLFYFF